MKLFDIGRVCVKVSGREAGKYCVVVDEKDTGYVIVTGPKSLSGVRRRSCNTRHLEPLETLLTIKAGADDDTVMKAIEQAGLTEKFRTRVQITV
ncbi:MAG: 50S ribosomal protein L14e [Candidatus Thorarchaeota archaeon]|nr:50S ribosomal protein L14e [Candidatus Thorarchaeota archaeon]